MEKKRLLIFSIFLVVSCLLGLGFGLLPPLESFFSLAMLIYASIIVILVIAAIFLIKRVTKRTWFRLLGWLLVAYGTFGNIYSVMTELYGGMIVGVPFVWLGLLLCIEQSHKKKVGQK